MTGLSLGEVEALALKAARGAGMDWGLAEEAAFAARWLEQAGIGGLALLARHLEAMPRPGLTIAGRVWRGAGGQPLCPIAAGAALSDHASLPEGPGQGAVHLAALAFPALLLPFLAGLGHRTGAVIHVEWPNCRAVLADGRLLALDEAMGLNTELAEVRVTSLPRFAQGATRPTPEPGTWAVLNRLAHKTYVPASDQSRRGAGGVGPDNA